MGSGLRSRLGWGLIGFLIAGLVCQVGGNYFLYGRFVQSSPLGPDESLLSPLTLLTAFTTLGTFCIAVAVAMAVGIVASLVVEEAFDRTLRLDAGIDDLGGDPDDLGDLGTTETA
jgi:hypothetical protein